MFDRLNDIRETLLKYVEARIELLRVDLQGRFEDVIVLLVYFVLLATAATAGLIFLFALLAVAINHWLGSSYLGWLAVFLLFALPFAGLLLFKNFFLRLIRRVLSRVLKEK